MLLPPIEEQDQLIEHVNTKIGEIDQVIERERALIAKLKELRTALISEVVTCKIDVRDEVPQRAEVAA